MAGAKNSGLRQDGAGATLTMIALARQLKMPDAQVRELGLAGLMHDIGKMLVPQDTLNKPGDLTQDEFTAIKDHPEAGHRLLLAGNGVSEVVLDVCLHHHEKMNGTGYPAGLAGDAISV
ncbi:HD-GYP domain-containing protein, partial [Janthinobacterium sp. HLX7-2]|uniref:HD-GYP domain-containing protein n=1 Tax=Janthinobacterium sp. HLX7-2 TaxID=1259331 RepID=UPI003F20DB78